MAANQSPLFPVTPNAGVMNCLLSTAMTNTKAYDGTEVLGTAKALALTAGAYGTRIDSFKVQYVSTNGAAASGTTNATVVRFWMNSGADPTIAANNQLLGELAIPAQTVTALATGVNPVSQLWVNQAIPAGYKVYAGLTVAVGGTNCALLVSPIAGDY